MEFKSITLDGPSGAGKSTLAKRVAEALHYVYVDTGAIYRTLGLLAHQTGTDLQDETAVSRMLSQADLKLAYGEDGLQHMYLNGTDVSVEIRTPEISKMASACAALPAVRSFLLEMQRELARTHNVVMDGRDIGTVVLPQADVKLFLTASAEARATRRHRELMEKGHSDSYAQVLADLEQRDLDDSTRATAPLRQAEDAILVDTSLLDLDQSFQALMDAIQGVVS